DAVTAQSFHFVERLEVLVAAKPRRRRNSELNGGRDHERLDAPPEGAQRDRDSADRILAPFSRRIAGEEADAELRLVMLRAVMRPERENQRRGSAPEVDPAQLRG